MSIGSLAKECSLSEFHFLRSFSRIHGITPYQFILSKELAKEGELLNSNRSVSDVAAISGFADVAAFSKAFKK
jgi:AraC family transcriptional regulator